MKGLWGSGHAELAATLRGAAVTQCLGFSEPDDDWTAMLFALDGKRDLQVFVLHPSLFQPGAIKSATYAWLPELVREANVRAVGILLSTWALKEEDHARLRAEKGPDASFDESPAAQELLWVMAVDRVGEEAWLSEIKKDERGLRRLGKWRQPGDGAGGVGMVSGEVLELLHGILRGES